MAAYRVTGPRAVALVAGKRVTLDQGALVPEGADADRVKHLLDVGLIAEVKPISTPKPAAKQAESK